MTTPKPPTVVQVREPALARHARAYYKLLEENVSGLQEIEGITYPVFVGKTTEIFEQLKISGSYYTPIRKLLTESGAIIQLIRGAGKNSNSEIALCGLPDNLAETIPDLTSPGGYATLLGYLEALSVEVAALSAWRESLSKGEMNIAEALRNHETRLAKLEKNGS